MNTQCVEWAGPRDKDDYGLVSIKVDGKWRSVRAHRLAYEEHVGPIPSGLWVLHKCDNPPCINPQHLYVGTAKDNARDMVERGRAASGNQYTDKAGFCAKGHFFGDHARCVICRRAKYRNDPEHRQKAIDRANDYYNKNKEERKAKARDYYRENRMRILKRIYLRREEIKNGEVR